MRTRPLAVALATTLTVAAAGAATARTPDRVPDPDGATLAGWAEGMP